MAEYFARRGNWQYGPMHLDQGQILGELKGEKNDVRLIEYGHLAELPRGTRPVQCGKCGAKFVADGFLNRHGDARHSGADMDAVAQERLAESLDRLNDASAPINMGESIEINTMPSRRGRRASREAAA